MRRSTQRSGIASADCLLDFRQTLRTIREKQANKFAQNSTIAIDACQECRMINHGICLVRSQKRESLRILEG